MTTTVALEFYLGTHHPNWLAHAGVPLFVSDSRLRDYKTLPVAVAAWAADSGGFSEIQNNGRWTVTPEAYVARVRRYRDEIGMLRWAAPQDWMCEPPIIYGGQVGPNRFVGTRAFLDPDKKMSHDELVLEHQTRTVRNFMELTALAPDLPFIPVLQGWRPWQYVRCAELYWELAGVDVTQIPLVGVGTMCRRQDSDEAGEILHNLHEVGVTRMHGFGFKIEGLARYGHLLVSADSLAWSAGAMYHGQNAERRGWPHGLMSTCTPGPHHPAKNCANCRPYALAWRGDVLAAVGSRPRHIQGSLFDA